MNSSQSSFKPSRSTKEAPSRYIYSSLANDEFRLLEFLDVGTLNFRLLHYTISHAPPYIIFNPPPSHLPFSKPITINGLKLPVSRGLRTALALIKISTHIQEPKPLLWVPAICINRSDPVELGIQLRAQKRIFEHSVAVYGWLEIGPPNPPERERATLEKCSKVFWPKGIPASVGNQVLGDMQLERKFWVKVRRGGRGDCVWDEKRFELGWPSLSFRVETVGYVHEAWRKVAAFQKHSFSVGKGVWRCAVVENPG